jgi:hypothetical protein
MPVNGDLPDNEQQDNKENWTKNNQRPGRFLCLDIVKRCRSHAYWASISVSMSYSLKDWRNKGHASEPIPRR